MTKIDRYKIFIRYCCSVGISPSQKELGRLLGYNNESYFSQIVNGKVDEPKDFMPKLKKIVPGLNVEWLQTGEGEMLAEQTIEQTNQNGDNIQGQNVKVTKTDNQKLLDVILKQTEQLSTSQAQISKSQEQIDRLITLIERK